MTAIFRNKMTPAVGAAVTLTSLNTSGPSAFTGQTLSGAGATATADGVLVAPGALAARADHAPSDKTATAFSTSQRIRLDKNPVGNVWQIANIIAGTVSEIGAVSGERVVASLNWVKDSSTLQVRSMDTYTNIPGLSLPVGVFFVANLWVDMKTGSVNVAVYDDAGTSLGVASLTTAFAAGLSVTQYQFGRCNTGETTATATFSRIAINNTAVDLGASPQMAVSTPPTIDFIPNMDPEAFDPVLIAARVKPTTAGATPMGISVSVVSAKYVDTGEAADTSLLQFVDPQTSRTNEIGRPYTIKASECKVAIAPALKRTVEFVVRTTGVDSEGLSVSATSKVKVFAHSLWGPSGAVRIDRRGIPSRESILSGRSVAPAALQTPDVID